MDPKKWWLSKTVIVNILTLAILIVNHFAQIAAIPADVAAAAVAVINVILRFFTTTPVTVK